MPATEKKDVAVLRSHGPAANVHPLSESEACPPPEKAVSVLLISPFEEDHIFLSNLFSHSKWHLKAVPSWRDALSHLADNTVPVVLCERELPDSTWKHVLSEISHLPDTPLLILTSRLADDYFWAEVLNLGGYDVLMKPFDHTEVIRVISLAWLNWKTCRERARKKTVVAPILALAAGL